MFGDLKKRWYVKINPPCLDVVCSVPMVNFPGVYQNFHPPKVFSILDTMEPYRAHTHSS